MNELVKNDGLSSVAGSVSIIHSTQDQSALLEKKYLSSLIQLSSSTEEGEPTPHLESRGQDINVSYCHDNESLVMYLDTYTRGSFEVFILSDANEFIVLNPKKRFTLPTTGVPIFIRSTCMSHFPRSCTGMVVAFCCKSERSWGDYKLGVIEAIRYFQDGNNHIVELWTPKKVYGDIVVPELLKCESWDLMESRLEFFSCSTNGIEFFFLNQVIIFDKKVEL